MNITKKSITWLAILTVITSLIVAYALVSDVQQISDVKVPLPTSDGRTTFINETVPWSLLLSDASCELKGEVKFLNHTTYDNQDALLVYSGIDHPGRNVFWTITPKDTISVGPNLFSAMPIPNGESLLGISLPPRPKYKKYDVTARIQYERLVDEDGKFVSEKGVARSFEKQCEGKTTIVLP
ncbi:MAG: hypothetical protein AAB483_01360 [Patescibacteria group bacterium]